MRQPVADLPWTYAPDKALMTRYEPTYLISSYINFLLYKYIGDDRAQKRKPVGLVMKLAAPSFRVSVRCVVILKSCNYHRYVANVRIRF